MRRRCTAVGLSPTRSPINLLDDRAPIEFSDVTKLFRERVVLDDFNVTVAPGEKSTLLGPSGSGKSAVPRILMTLEPFQDGALTLASVTSTSRTVQAP